LSALVKADDQDADGGEPHNGPGRGPSRTIHEADEPFDADEYERRFPDLFDADGGTP
jgi:hypothetical protein